MSNKNIGRDGDHNDKWQAGKCAYISLGSFDGNVCADPHESEDDDLDFAMLTPTTRTGPCKAAAAPEVDPVEKRLEREREAAPFIADRVDVGDEVRVSRGRVGDGYRFRVSEVGKGGFGETIVWGHNYGPVRATNVERVEVKHGSEKSSEMAHPCQPPKRVPFSVLRRAYEMLDITAVPSVRWLERNGSAPDRNYAKRVRIDFAQSVAEEME